LRRLLGLLAAQTGQVANLTSLAERAGIDRQTVQNYLSLLSNAFIVFELSPWRRVPTGRSFKRSKWHLLDSGLASHLLTLTSAKLQQRTPQALTAFGQLLESFAIGEVLKQVSWLDEPAEAYYWRTYDGLEVDLVVERYDGAVLAFEVKAAQRLKDGDLAGLRALRDQVGPDFVAGVVLHLGGHAAQVEDRLFTMPVDHLWGKREP
ncbi:MAG: DUF4143 domain-containing protein, partial [Propionibacteriaceae bacterium]|nr:DUF4143 domain-containing protein [Propionibacteriaceae bacterium]